MRIRKLVLLLIDFVSTILTLLTGLRENPVLVYFTGRYDLVRSRFREGRINYNIVRNDQINVSALPDLREVGDQYRFYSVPRRSPANLGEDRSTCMRVNSMSAMSFSLNYDDFFGRGPRREQVFLYSISAAHCTVINFRTEWLADTCITQRGGGNETACHEFILENFDALLAKRSLHVGIPQDFGTPGVPFMKCLGRPLVQFEFITDLLVLQSFWAGGSYHVEVQSSSCWAMPRILDDNWQWGLFQVKAADESATVFSAVKPINWFVVLVSRVHGVVWLVMIFRGIYIAFFKDNAVRYVPSRVRRRLLGLFDAPLAFISVLVFPPEDRTHALTFRGYNPMASASWMNHWLYIAFGAIDAVLNTRAMYIVLEMGTWMLTKHVSFENFIFVCSALSKLTWITCFVHTTARFCIKFVLHLLKALVWTQGTTAIGFLNWYVDATALFVSYKIYSVLVCLLLLLLLKLNGATTLMVPQSHFKQPVYGGNPGLPVFWRNEIMCDLVVFCIIQLLAAHLIASVLLLSRLRRATYNRVLRLLQSRYIFVAWDVFAVMDGLGIDPFDDKLAMGDVAVTNCPFAALMQQLYASGPSGWVEFIGDDVFLLPSATDDDPSAAKVIILARYPLDIARSMQLFVSKERRVSTALNQWYAARGGDAVLVIDDVGLMSTDSESDRVAATKRFTSLRHRKPSLVLPASTASASSSGSPSPAEIKMIQQSETAVVPSAAAPIVFGDRTFRIHAEHRWGRLLLVDVRYAPGQILYKADGVTLEFVVPSALSFLHADEVTAFMGSRGKLRIC
ncbi:hypothetical protein P43SY_006485 [Pythium insidiosum]|uniref:Transmembrane protein n=1 Tax=Pythium insidiosum TaxID=114742 RepID=A0AAD5LE15_PYTIN|nr:hypothetical protein P43SY_006485 [Pythium insidiosum]